MDADAQNNKLSYFRGMKEGKYLIVVGGPTAAGKTELAIRLALHFDTEVLSCDSRQFYRQLRIGTATPSPTLLQQVPHHFIGHRSVETNYSAGDYVRDALQVLARIFKTRDYAVLVGGSGFYQKALCEGLDTFPKVSPLLRKQVENDYREGGIAALQEELARKDPAYFTEVDIQNPARLKRALAVIRASGKPFSSFRTGRGGERSFRPIYLWLHWPRPQLYHRINARVEAMMDRGLLQEVKSLQAYRHLDALQTVGYQELFNFLEGDMALAEAVEQIKQHTRRYAKRQITWRRRDGHWLLLRPGAWQEALDYVDLTTRQGVRLKLHRSDGLSEIRLLGGENLLARLWLRPGKGKSILVGPFFSAPTAAPSVARMLIQQALRRLPQEKVFAASPPSGKPFLAEAGFDPIEAAPPGMDALLSTAGQSGAGLEVYCKTT